MNRLPKVKAFINDHASDYENFQVKYIGGADPTLVFVKEDDTEERIDVAAMSTEEINAALVERGFNKKQKEEVPPPPSDEDEDLIDNNTEEKAEERKSDEL